jgi:hypothetical protein
VFTTQDYNEIEASLPVRDGPKDQIARSKNRHIYSLEYWHNFEVTMDDSRCNESDAGPTSYELCIQDTPTGSPKAAMIPYHTQLVTKNGCRKDINWEDDRGCAAFLRTSFLDTTVSYQRTDGRILSY